MAIIWIASLIADENAGNSGLLNGLIGLAIGALATFFAMRLLAKPTAAQQPLAPPKPPEPAKPSGAPLRILSLLQREGRLLDFLLEDVQGYSDSQIGAAVREIHRDCRKAIQEHLVLEPILPGEDGSRVTVSAGFDPASIQLTGNVTGKPPFQGTLLHHGWRVKQIKLAQPPAGQDEFIVQPANVEL